MEVSTERELNKGKDMPLRTSNSDVSKIKSGSKKETKQLKIEQAPLSGRSSDKHENTPSRRALTN